VPHAEEKNTFVSFVSSLPTEKKPLSQEEETSWCWRVTLPDRVLQVSSTPWMTRAEVLERYPDAVEVEPHTSTVDDEFPKLTPSEERALEEALGLNP
jgi:hypothetical protein